MAAAAGLRIPQLGLGLGPRLLEGVPTNPDCVAPVDMPAWEIALRIMGCAVCLALAALFSGLTLGGYSDVGLHLAKLQ